MNLIKVRLVNSKFHSANVMKTQHSVIKVFHSDIGTNDQADRAAFSSSILKTAFICPGFPSAVITCAQLPINDCSLIFPCGGYISKC